MGSAPHFDLLSGPDLGGGHLHQLTVELAADGLSRILFHAQAGGADASGPPVGDPRPLGYFPVDGYCPLGGAGCFHREFELGLGDAPRARQAYNRMRFVFGTMLAQAHGVSAAAPPVFIDQALTTVAQGMAARGLPWILGGGGALFVRGLDRPPGDLDLGTSRAGAEAIGQLLEPYLIEPLAWTRWADGRCYGARAFVGTLTEGIRVEWAAHAERPASPAALEWGVEAPSRPLKEVTYAGVSVPVSAVEYAVARSFQRGDHPGLEAILSSPLAAEIDPVFLEDLLVAPGGATPAVRRVMDRLRGPPRAR